MDVCKRRVCRFIAGGRGGGPRRGTIRRTRLPFILAFITGRQTLNGVWAGGPKRRTMRGGRKGVLRPGYSTRSTTPIDAHIRKESKVKILKR